MIAHKSAQRRLAGSVPLPHQPHTLRADAAHHVAIEAFSSRFHGHDVKRTNRRLTQASDGRGAFSSALVEIESTQDRCGAGNSEAVPCSSVAGER